MPTPVTRTDLAGLKLLGRGKVRDNYVVDDALLIISTDRISAFDYILPDGIPDKGKVLNQLSLFWFDFLGADVPNHLLEHRVERFPESLRPHRDMLLGRSVLVRRLEMLPVECVARGYLSGSGFKDYQKTGRVCGIRLSAGLRESDRLPEPIFTPAIKATSGHDENIPFSKMTEIVGRETAELARDLTLSIYSRACRHAEERGIIIADTKIEFGRDGTGLILADEVITPDSSRFWPASEYRPGGPQRSFDKQYVRDHLEASGWDKNPPAPELPVAIIEGTRERYLEIYSKLTGGSIE